MGLLANLAFMVLFAWVVRGLLSAREVTWPRTFLAVVFGTLRGALVAGRVHPHRHRRPGRSDAAGRA